MSSKLFVCDGCNDLIPIDKARVRCQVCEDYDSCADCHVMEVVSDTHTADHGYEVFKGGVKVLSRAPGEREAKLENLSAAPINMRNQPSSTSQVARQEIADDDDSEEEEDEEEDDEEEEEEESESDGEAYNAGYLYRHALLRQQMEDDHFVNMIQAQANRNALGGWRRDSNGDEYYEDGYV